MKRALVTGAGRRLGRAMAHYLGSRGYDVAVHFATSGEGAAEVVAEITAMGQTAAALQADLLVEDETRTLLARAAKALGGPITCLVNNASIFEYDRIDTATTQSWERHIGSNLRAPFVLTQAFAEQLPEPETHGETDAVGLIVNMLDQRILKPTPEFMTYTIAKMGLWALTRTSAQALAPRIRVNAIAPGTVLQGDRQSQEHFNKQRAASLLQRGADAADITAALGYFLDSGAVTGQVLCVDGGQHLAWQTPDVLGVEGN